jgi:hypothetical protein
VKIKKYSDQQRVFIALGSPIGPNSEFKFFKKTEMPEPDWSAEPIVEDYVDLKLTVIDNGNDKIIISGSILGKNSKKITVSCDKFIPKL